MLGPWRPRLAAGPALAGRVAARAAARAHGGGRRSCADRRNHRLLRLHAQRRRERSDHRRVRPRAGAARGGMAAVRSCEAPRVLADEARPPRDERFLHREAAGLIEVPERLGWWRDRTGGAAWLESLPQLAEECAERWSLRLGEPFGQGHVSLTAPATLSDGGQA